MAQSQAERLNGLVHSNKYRAPVDVEYQGLESAALCGTKGAQAGDCGPPATLLDRERLYGRSEG